MKLNKNTRINIRLSIYTIRDLKAGYIYNRTSNLFKINPIIAFKYANFLYKLLKKD